MRRRLAVLALLLLAGCRPTACRWQPQHRDTLTESISGAWRCPAPGR